MNRWIRLKVAGSGLLLLVTAAYHGSGHGEIGAALGQSGLPAGLQQILHGQWLFFSWHLTLLATVALAAAVTGAPWLRPVLLFCGAVALGDFVWVLSLAGWFPGTLLLLLGALGLVVGGLYWRADSPLGGER